MSIEENAVEQITVNPDQTAQVVKNEDKFETVPQMNVAVFDPSVVTTKTNKSLNDLVDWKEFLHDPWKAMESGEERFEKYKPVADLSRDPVWYALTQKYGRDIVNKTDTILDYYHPAENVFARTINAYNYSADNLRLSEARKRLSDATMAGDTTKVKEIENEIAELKYRLANADMPFKSKGLNSLMDVSASAARNLPEVIAINISSAAAAIPTAGVSVPAGRIASAGVVYNDTYNLEFGATLHEIMSANPSLPEVEARKIASRVANRNALIESAPMLIPGLDFLAGTGQRVAGTVLNKGAREGFKLLAKRNPAAAKKVLGETAKLLGGIGIEVGTESLTEMWQEIGSEAAVEAATTGRDVGDITDERIMAFVRDPFSEENAALWETFGYTAEGVLGFEAITRALTGVGGRVAGRVRSGRARPATTEEKAIGATANATLADRLFRHRQESEVATQSPELTDRANQAMVDRGVVPEKIYFDKDMVEQLLGDSSVQQAVRDLELQRAYEDSRNNGGVVEVDFTKYDSVVNTNEELFQRIKNAISFSPETLSLNQFQAYLDSLDAKGMGEIERARQSTDSLYNRVYNMMMQLHNDDKLAQAQAIQAQFMANRIGAFRVGQTRTGEDVAARLEIRTPGQPVGIGVQPVVASQQPQQDIVLVDYSLPEYTGETLAGKTYTKKGQIKESTFAKMRALFTPEQLAQETTILGTTNTFEQMLRNSFSMDNRAAMALSSNKIRQIAADFGVSPAQLHNAIRIARGEEPVVLGEDSVSVYSKSKILVDGKERPTTNSEQNPIANTEEGLVAFWQWFGDSKAVDVLGRPLVLYHGSKATGIKSFDTGGGQRAVFLTDNPEVAETYSTEAGKKYPLYAKLMEPAEFDAGGKRFDELYIEYNGVNHLEVQNLVQTVKYEGGHDGLIIENVIDTSESAGVPRILGNDYIVFDDAQLRPAEQVVQQEGVLHQFIGEEANLEKEAPELAERLNRAREMQDEGKSDEEIFNETHVHVGPDGRLRLQISDKDAKLKNLKRRKDGRLQAININKGKTLGDILEHDLLFELYPQLKDIPIAVGGNETALHYETDHPENIERIQIKSKEQEKELISSILHEVQHAIQHISNWPSGGSISSYSASKTPEVYERWKLLDRIGDKLNNAGFGGYWKVTTSGQANIIEEDESRAIQDSPGVKELAAKDKEFADMIERLKQLNKSLEYYDSHNARIRYMRLFGEAEARLTEKLRTKSQEELNALDPYGYFDVSEFIVRDPYGTELKELGAPNPKAPKNTQRIGEFTITLSPEATEAVTGDKGVVAGTFFRDGDKLVISLTPNANPTTFTHELFHWFSTEMQDAYNSGQMTDYWKSKAEALAKMVDAKIEDGQLVLSATQEEHAADMFLEYLREGKVDNEAVKPLFAYIQTLFKSVFKLLGLRELRLNKESEELFGAIFNAQEVIEDEQRLAGILAIEKPEGADQGLYDMYVGEMLNSRVRGTQELYKKLFAIDKFRKSNEYEKIQSMTRLDVAEQLNGEVRYIVVDEAAKHDNNAQATWVALQTNPDTADIELSVQQVQEILDNTPDKTAEINRIIEQRMNEYVQNRFKITPEEMGLKASRNSSKVKALLAESLMREGKTIQDFDVAYKELLATADNQVAKSSLHRLADKNYWDTLESRAVERYAFALANNDSKAMTETRRDQAIVNAIRMRAEAITNRARRFQESAEAFRGAQQKIAIKGENGKKARSEYKYGAYDYDLLQSILEKFGFDINYVRRRPIPVGEKMDNWITEQEATTLTRAGELRNFIPFINDGHDGTFASMTGADFEKLDAVFNAIKSVAGARYTIVLEKERLMLSEMVGATAQKFENMGISAFDKKDGYWAKHFGTLASWTNPEPVVRNLFPDVVLKNVWLPFVDAAVRAERYGSQWVDRYRAAKGKVDLSNKAREYSTGHRLSNKQVADILLSMGNEHAYENFRMAYGLDEAQAETIVSEALTAQPALADFVKEVWATYGDATTQLDKEFTERTNTLFVEKSHREFEINGIKFGGGYVPVRKQLDYVPTDVRAGNQGGMVHDKKFEKLVVAQADGNVRSIVDITENELFQSAKQAYTAVKYNNARKLLLADGMRETIGERAFSFLDGWLASYMMPKYDTTAWVRPLATLSSMGALGFRASTAILQLSGLVPAAIAVSPKYFARGLHMAMKNGEWAPVMATRKGANKSDYMAVRIGDPRSSLLGQSIIDAVRSQDASTTFGKTTQFLFTKVGNAAMWGIQQIDTVVANVTWNGAYLRALDKGMSETEARREADSVVRTVQSDSMQISRSEALQTPMARMFTSFATWIMAMQSQIRADLATRQFAHAAVWGAAYMFLSPIFESFLKEALRLDVLLGADDDDEEYIDRVLKTCYNEISSTVGTTIIPPASIGGAALTAILSGVEEGVTGERNYFDVRESNVPALQTVYRGINAARYGVAGILSGDTEKLGKAATYGASTISTEAGRLVKILLAE